jgi:hypothetical protein
MYNNHMILTVSSGECSFYTVVVLERIQFLTHLQKSFPHAISGKHLSATDCSIVYDASYHHTITYV